MTVRRPHNAFTTLYRVVVFSSDDHVVDSTGPLTTLAVAESEKERLAERSKWRYGRVVKIMVCHPEWMFVE